TILRGEVPDRAAEWNRAGSGEEADPRKLSESDTSGLNGVLQDRLTTTGLGLGLLRLQLDTGRTEEAKATLAALQADFQILLHDTHTETEPLSARVSTGSSRRALLVEDDLSEREFLARFLRRSGLQVDTAGDGADALDYLRTHDQPDVVLLDMGLPHV